MAYMISRAYVYAVLVSIEIKSMPELTLSTSELELSERDQHSHDTERLKS